MGDVRYIINTSGAIMVTYVYDTWGKVISTTGSLASTVGANNPIRYRGYYYDTETSLYYLQSRYYDPVTGRFISPDQIIDLGNLYAYCGNDPVNFTDSTGYSKWDDFWKSTTGQVVAWVAVGVLVVASIALIAPVAIGTIAATSLAGAIMVGAGVGILAGVGGSIISQGGLKDIKNVDPRSVATSGLIGGVIGAVSGAASFGFAQIGQAYGQALGYTLSNARHIGSGIRFAKVFGLTTPTLMKAGFFAGKVVGGVSGGMVSNYAANNFVSSTFGSHYAVNNPNCVRSVLLKLFQWMNPFA